MSLALPQVNFYPTAYLNYNFLPPLDASVFTVHESSTTNVINSITLPSIIKFVTHMLEQPMPNCLQAESLALILPQDSTFNYKSSAYKELRSASLLYQLSTSTVFGSLRDLTISHPHRLNALSELILTAYQFKVPITEATLAKLPDLLSSYTTTDSLYKSYESIHKAVPYLYHVLTNQNKLQPCIASLAFCKFINPNYSDDAAAPVLNYLNTVFQDLETKELLPLESYLKFFLERKSTHLKLQPTTTLFHKPIPTTANFHARSLNGNDSSVQLDCEFIPSNEAINVRKEFIGALLFEDLVLYHSNNPIYNEKQLQSLLAKNSTLLSLAHIYLDCPAFEISNKSHLQELF